MGTRYRSQTQKHTKAGRFRDPKHHLSPLQGWSDYHDVVRLAALAPRMQQFYLLHTTSAL